MAKGNNGNLLQHAIETEIADRIGREGLFLVSTHAMAPFEACELRANVNEANYARFYRALTRSATGDWAGAPAVMRAYRATSANLYSYPNTCELITSLLGRSKVCGWLAEQVEEKVSVLSRRWRGSGISIHGGSWRGFPDDFVNLLLQSEMPAWVWSMDPYTYSEGFEDDADLHPEDLSGRLPAVVEAMFDALPGVFVVTCYGMRPRARSGFLEAAAGFADSVRGEHKTFEMPQGGNRHSCVAIYRGEQEEVLLDVERAWHLVKRLP